MQAAQRLAQVAACCEALAQLAQHMGLRAQHGAPVALRQATRARAGMWKVAGLSSDTGNPTARGRRTQMLHGVAADAQVMRADDEKSSVKMPLRNQRNTLKVEKGK